MAIPKKLSDLFKSVNAELTVDGKNLLVKFNQQIKLSAAETIADALLELSALAELENGTVKCY
jgi:hypothetical protein